MSIRDLKDPKLQEKLASAKSTNELLALAKEGGIELTEDQLEAVSGGGVWEDHQYEIEYTICNNCGKEVEWDTAHNRPTMCPYCHFQFEWSDGWTHPDVEY